MKRLFTIIAAVLLTLTIWAQSPQKMSYQAVIRDGDGILVTNQSVGMQVSILEDATPVYVETHSTATDANGLVTIEIGTGKTSDDFSAINWANGTYFIKTETDPTGGTTYTITGTNQLLSVPYALYAKTSESSAEADGLRQQIRILEDNLIAAGTYKLADIDGNSYNTIKIGNQVWLAENLKTTKYNDGTPIPNITDNIAWAALTTGAYSDYDNTPANSTTYGRLYNWYAVDNNAATKVASNGGKNVCPTGWHIPSDAEWTVLTDYLTNNGYGYGGSGNDIGKSMANTSGWTTDPTAGNVGNDQASNNSSGFTALPGDFRGNGGAYGGIGGSACWWSSTEFYSTDAYDRYMLYDLSNVGRNYNDKHYGFSVRCLRD